MSKSHRKSRLKRYLKDCRQALSLKHLADHFDCSEKTIRRDIEELACEQQAPWYVYQNKVYFDERRYRQLELDGFWLSEQELKALFVLDHALEKLSNGVLIQQLKPIKPMLLKILGESGREESLTRKVKILEIASRNIAPKVFQTLTQSLSESKCLQIRYWKRHTNQSQLREVSPLQLVRYKDNWYLDAYCHHRKAIRSFSLDAILDCTIQENATHEIEEQALQKHFADSYGIFSGEADKVAELHFNEYISRWIQNEIWHPDQITEKQADGSVIMKLPYHYDTELIQDILKYGPNVKVLSPPELKQKVQDQLKRTLEQYQNE